MAVTYDVDTTSNSADVIVHQIYSLGVQNLTLRIFLNNSFVEWVDNIDTTWLLDYTYTYSGLSPNTLYSFEIEFWDYRTLVDSISGSFTTDSGGGGGGDDPYFAAEGRGAASAIDIDIFNTSDIPGSAFFRYTIQSSTYSDSYDKYSSYHTFTSVPNGTYIVRVYYVYNDREYTIYASNGSSYIEVEVDDGSGGGSGWHLYPDDSTADLGYLTGTCNLPFNNGLSANILYCYCFILNTATTVTISSSGSGDTEGWISAWNQTGWDDANGVPTSFIEYNDDSGDNRNFQITRQCNAGEYYYIWFRGYNGNAQSGSITITISLSSSQAWRLNDRTNLSVFTSLADDVSNYSCYVDAGYVAKYIVSFSQSGTAEFSSSGSIAVSGYFGVSDNSFDDSTGIPYYYDTHDVGSNNFSFSMTVNAGTTYYLWVKGNDENVSGTTYLSIKAPGWKKIDMTAGRVVSSYTSGPLSIGEKVMIRLQFIPETTGKYALYTSGSLDTHGYLGSSPDFYKPSGLPSVYTTDDDDSGSGTNCRIEYDLTAGATYYFWVRPHNQNSSGTTTILIDKVDTASTKGFWVYTNGEWVKVTVYVYTNGDWVKTKPCLYTNGEWIEGS